MIRHSGECHAKDHDAHMHVEVSVCVYIYRERDIHADTVVGVAGLHCVHHRLAVRCYSVLAKVKLHAQELKR